MASRAEKLRDRLGAHMAESMGAATAGQGTGSRPNARRREPAPSNPDRVEYRLDDGTSVTVSSPAADGGADAVIRALEQALELARRAKERGRAA
jgi:hypothetical protein